MYEFADGKSDPKNKFWLSLTCVYNDFPMYIVLPTSKTHKYVSGFPSLDTVLIKMGESEHFDEDTIIDLKQLKKQDEKTLLEACDLGKFNYVGQLESVLLQRIEEAIDSAVTLSPEIIDILLCKNITK